MIFGKFVKDLAKAGSFIFSIIFKEVQYDN